MRAIEEIEEIGRIKGQLQRLTLEIQRLERNNDILQEDQRALSEEWERLRIARLYDLYNSQLEAEIQRLMPRWQISMARSEELIAERQRLQSEQRRLRLQLFTRFFLTF